MCAAIIGLAAIAAFFGVSFVIIVIGRARALREQARDFGEVDE